MNEAIISFAKLLCNFLKKILNPPSQGKYCGNNNSQCINGDNVQQTYNNITNNNYFPHKTEEKAIVDNENKMFIGQSIEEILKKIKSLGEQYCTNRDIHKFCEKYIGCWIHETFTVHDVHQSHVSVILYDCNICIFPLKGAEKVFDVLAKGQMITIEARIDEINEVIIMLKDAIIVDNI